MNDKGFHQCGRLEVHLFNVKRSVGKARAFDASKQKAPPFWDGAFQFQTRIGLLCGFFFLNFFTGLLIDNFHRQANFAAIIEAQQFDFHFLTLLQNI